MFERFTERYYNIEIIYSSVYDYKTKPKIKYFQLNKELDRQREREREKIKQNFLTVFINWNRIELINIYGVFLYFSKKRIC